MSTVTVSKKIDAIAIGGFDGMHIGHQRLFDALGENGLIIAIETGYANLTPGRERENFTRHPLSYYPLDSIRDLDGKGFIAKLKEEFPLLNKIVVGYDFHFGKDRQCSHEDLKRLFDGEVVIIDAVELHNDAVHAHKIRHKIEMGDIRGANAFLGHDYTIRGKVVSGQGIGAKELVPTINIEHEGFLLPKEGVYATLTRIDGEEHYHPSVSFVGHRVTTDGSFAVESHILDTGVSCTHEASITFLSFIRENMHFENLETLKAAIGEDIAKARTEHNHLSL